MNRRRMSERLPDQAGAPAVAVVLLLAAASCAGSGGADAIRADDHAGSPDPVAATGNDAPASGYTTDADPPAEIDAGDFALTPDVADLAPALEALEDELGAERHRTVGQMMDAANRDERPLCNRDAHRPVHEQAGGDLVGFCWNEGDDDVEYWYTQGTTTTGDATAEGSYDGQRVVATSWYHRPDDDPSTDVDKGVRISFNPMDEDGPGRYRHVLLVEPTLDGDTAGYEPVTVHAGGIAWYGNLLYVADTRQGFRIFDLDRLYAVDTGDRDLFGPQPDGTFHAFDYALVLPQVGWARDSGDEPLRYSFVGLDRSSSPHSLVVGEYAPPEGGDTRVVRYPLDEADGLPAREPGGDRAVAGEAYDTGIRQMQGVVAHEDRWWFASSNGRGEGPEGHYGFLRVWDAGGPEVRTYGWAYGPEDLSYRPGPDGDDRIWTNTEYPTYRSVFGAPVASFD